MYITYSIGHNFRRTSATVLATAGADEKRLQRHGGWKSSTVAEEYVEETIEYKQQTSNLITQKLSEKKFSLPELKPKLPVTVFQENEAQKLTNIDELPVEIVYNAPEVRAHVLINIYITMYHSHVQTTKYFLSILFLDRRCYRTIS